MINKVPSQISFGVDLFNSYKFDDKLQIRTSDFKIAGFKIYLQDNKICGIAIIYLNQRVGRKIIFTDTYQNQKYTSLYEFDIPPNDYIQVIFGHYDEQINQLGIITYSGKQEIFGIDSGKQFNYMFMGYTFMGCSGNFTSGSIYQLSFQVQKLPKDYIYQYLNPLLEILYPSLENNQIENPENIKSQTLNLSGLTILNRSEHSLKNQDQFSKLEEIKTIEYKGFDFQKATVEETQQQQHISNTSPSIQKNRQNEFTPRDLRYIEEDVKIGIKILKFITKH